MCSYDKPCWRKTSSSLLEQAEAKMFDGLSKPVDGSFVEISNGNRIRTIKVGTDNKYYHRLPILLLHGFAGACGFWTLNLMELTKKQNVYAVDLLGFGRSSRPKFPSNHEEAEELFITALEEWRKEAGLSKFILVGHSFGGFIAASYATKYQDRVGHLILVDPWGFPTVPEPGFEPIQVPRRFKVIASVITAFNPLSIIRALGPLGPSVVRNARSDLREKFERLYGEGDFRIMDYIYHSNAQKPSGETAFMTMADINPLPYSKDPMINRLKYLSQDFPITLLYGSNSWMETISDFNKLAGYHENIEIIEIKGAGHHVYADKADEFNRIVNNICDVYEFSRHFQRSISREEGNRDASLEESDRNDVDMKNRSIGSLEESEVTSENQLLMEFETRV